MTRAAAEDSIVLVEAPCGSDLHAQALRLREAILRRPLGLPLTEEEIADDAGRRHFCAVADGAVVASVSFKPLGPHTLQLKQMVVAEDRQREGLGARLLAYAEDWARRVGYGVIILNARIGAEEFYTRLGYRCEGDVFDENTIPHIRMTKRLG
jgi:GNAT superfamily N-acetyltransferase